MCLFTSIVRLQLDSAFLSKNMFLLVQVLCICNVPALFIIYMVTNPIRKKKDL